MSRELPIFPLPIVLFPGAPQPLHVFEPRYRRLLADCQEGDGRFGIAYALADAATGTEAAPDPGAVGCVALIRSVQPLPDGRANILTVGERRFVLRRWVPSERPYRVAEVEEFDDDPVDPGDPAEVGALAADVRARFVRLTRALDLLTEREDEPVELASDPQRLSFQVAAALELDAQAKGVLLATRSTARRLRQLAAVLAPLAADAERRAAVRQGAKGNGRGGRRPEIERAT